MFNFIKKLFRRNKKMGNELERLINDFLMSRKKKQMEDSHKYYTGQHDVLNRHRDMINENGELEPLKNVKVATLVDNQYSKLVDQKTNYLLSKTPTFQSDNDEYTESLKGIINDRFLKLLRMVGKDAYKYGIGWLYVYIGNDGKLKFKRFDGRNVIPVWKDEEHEELDYVVRLYTVKEFKDGGFQTSTKVEVYRETGVEYYNWNNSLMVDREPESYLRLEDNNGDVQGYNWLKLPVIPFRYDETETPLLVRVKSLQDALNELISVMQDRVEEDPRNTILIVKNYDGTDWSEFRHNLRVHGVIPIRSDETGEGGVDSLKIEVNNENYKVLVDIFKKAIIENGRGFDAKTETLGANPNQLNIRSMYSDIDLDANSMEVEFKASFENLMWFVNNHLRNTGSGISEDEKLDIIFNRDILVNESQAIEDCQKSVGILSRETIIGQHPWSVNVEEEIKKIRDEKQEKMEDYGGFGEHNHSDDIDE